jgi:hypothetical protein
MVHKKWLGNAVSVRSFRWACCLANLVGRPTFAVFMRDPSPLSTAASVSQQVTPVGDCGAAFRAMAGFAAFSSGPARKNGLGGCTARRKRSDRKRLPVFLRPAMKRFPTIFCISNAISLR